MAAQPPPILLPFVKKIKVRTKTSMAAFILVSERLLKKKKINKKPIKRLKWDLYFRENTLKSQMILTVNFILIIYIFPTFL